jgi:restriction system protein
MAPRNSLELKRPKQGGTQVIEQSIPASAEAQPAPKCNGRQEHGLEQLRNLLRAALDTPHAIDLERFKQTDPYPEPEPSALRYLEFPPEPRPQDPRYRPEYAPSKTTAMLEREEREARERYLHDYAEWSETVKDIEAKNQQRYNEHAAAVKRWKAGRQKFLKARAAEYEVVARRKAAYEAMRAEGVEDYFRHVLSASPLPDGIGRLFDIQYLRDLKLLIIDHSIPKPEEMPRFKGMVHVESKGALVEVPLSDSQLRRLYYRVLCQIGLRTLHELFDADVASALDAVAFNGWIEENANGTGGKKRNFVAWVQARRREFKRLNLRDSDVELSFKALRGGVRESLWLRPLKAA